MEGKQTRMALTQDGVETVSEKEKGMMRHSEQLADLAKALSAAQGEMENAAKAKLNPHFKSKYADLGSVWDAIREPLAKNGLSVIQLPFTDEAGLVRMSTLLMHASGQWIEASYALPPTKADPQGFGSAITYMKRYALTGLGVAPEDDDGNAASVKSGRGGTITEDQVETIFDLIKLTKSDTLKLCKYVGVESVSDISVKDYEKVITALNLKVKAVQQ